MQVLRVPMIAQLGVPTVGERPTVKGVGGCKVLVRTTGIVHHRPRRQKPAAGMLRRTVAVALQDGSRQGSPGSTPPPPEALEWMRRPTPPRQPAWRNVLAALLLVGGGLALWCSPREAIAGANNAKPLARTTTSRTVAETEGASTGRFVSPWVADKLAQGQDALQRGRELAGPVLADSLSRGKEVVAQAASEPNNYVLGMTAAMIMLLGMTLAMRKVDDHAAARRSDALTERGSGAEALAGPHGRVLREGAKAVLATTLAAGAMELAARPTVSEILAREPGAGGSSTGASSARGGWTPPFAVASPPSPEQLEAAQRSREFARRSRDRAAAAAAAAAAGGATAAAAAAADSGPLFQAVAARGGSSVIAGGGGSAGLGYYQQPASGVDQGTSSSPAAISPPSPAAAAAAVQARTPAPGVSGSATPGARGSVALDLGLEPGDAAGDLQRRAAAAGATAPRTEEQLTAELRTAVSGNSEALADAARARRRGGLEEGLLDLQASALGQELGEDGGGALASRFGSVVLDLDLQLRATAVDAQGAAASAAELQQKLRAAAADAQSAVVGGGEALPEQLAAAADDAQGAAASAAALQRQLSMAAADAEGAAVSAAALREQLGAAADDAQRTPDSEVLQRQLNAAAAVVESTAASATALLQQLRSAADEVQGSVESASALQRQLSAAAAEALEARSAGSSTVAQPDLEDVQLGGAQETGQLSVESAAAKPAAASAEAMPAAAKQQPASGFFGKLFGLGGTAGQQQQDTTSSVQDAASGVEVAAAVMADAAAAAAASAVEAQSAAGTFAAAFQSEQQPGGTSVSLDLDDTDDIAEDEAIAALQGAAAGSRYRPRGSVALDLGMEGGQGAQADAAQRVAGKTAAAVAAAQTLGFQPRPGTPSRQRGEGSVPLDLGVTASSQEEEAEGAAALQRVAATSRGGARGSVALDLGLAPSSDLASSKARDLAGSGATAKQQQVAPGFVAAGMTRQRGQGSVSFDLDDVASGAEASGAEDDESALSMLQSAAAASGRGDRGSVALDLAVQPGSSPTTSSPPATLGTSGSSGGGSGAEREERQGGLLGMLFGKKQPATGATAAAATSATAAAADALVGGATEAVEAATDQLSSSAEERYFQLGKKLPASPAAGAPAGTSASGPAAAQLAGAASGAAAATAGAAAAAAGAGTVAAATAAVSAAAVAAGAATAAVGEAVDALSDAQPSRQRREGSVSLDLNVAALSKGEEAERAAALQRVAATSRGGARGSIALDLGLSPSPDLASSARAKARDLAGSGQQQASGFVATGITRQRGEGSVSFDLDDVALAGDSEEADDSALQAVQSAAAATGRGARGSVALDLGLAAGGARAAQQEEQPNFFAKLFGNGAKGKQQQQQTAAGMSGSSGGVQQVAPGFVATGITRQRGEGSVSFDLDDVAAGGEDGDEADDAALQAVLGSSLGRAVRSSVALDLGLSPSSELPSSSPAAGGSAAALEEQRRAMATKAQELAAIGEVLQQAEQKQQQQQAVISSVAAAVTGAAKAPVSEAVPAASFMRPSRKRREGSVSLDLEVAALSKEEEVEGAAALQRVAATSRGGARGSIALDLGLAPSSDGVKARDLADGSAITKQQQVAPGFVASGITRQPGQGSVSFDLDDVASGAEADTAAESALKALQSAAAASGVGARGSVALDLGLAAAGARAAQQEEQPNFFAKLFGLGGGAKDMQQQQAGASSASATAGRLPTDVGRSGSTGNVQQVASGFVATGITRKRGEGSVSFDLHYVASGAEAVDEAGEAAALQALQGSASGRAAHSSVALDLGMAPFSEIPSSTPAAGGSAAALEEQRRELVAKAQRQQVPSSSVAAAVAGAAKAAAAQEQQRPGVFNKLLGRGSAAAEDDVAATAEGTAAALSAALDAAALGSSSSQPGSITAAQAVAAAAGTPAGAATATAGSSSSGTSSGVDVGGVSGDQAVGGLLRSMNLQPVQDKELSKYDILKDFLTMEAPTIRSKYDPWTDVVNWQPPARGAREDDLVKFILTVDAPATGEGPAPLDVVGQLLAMTPPTGEAKFDLVKGLRDWQPPKAESPLSGLVGMVPPRSRPKFDLLSGLSSVQPPSGDAPLDILKGLKSLADKATAGDEAGGSSSLPASSAAIGDKYNPIKDLAREPRPLQRSLEQQPRRRLQQQQPSSSSGGANGGKAAVAVAASAAGKEPFVMSLGSAQGEQGQRVNLYGVIVSGSGKQQ